MNEEPFVELPPPSSTRRTPLKRLRNETKAQYIDDTLQVSASSWYERTKRYFHRSTKVRMVGRTVERAVIQNFWRNAVEGNPAKPKVLYVCGNPGTGKTALIDEMLLELTDPNPTYFQIFKTNCMMHEDPRDSLLEIAKQMQVRTVQSHGDKYSDALSAVVHHLQTSGKITVFVLDEIDQIAIKDGKLLEKVFTLPSGQNISLIIIGIANALDLSIKYFTASPGEVQVLNFAPYSVEDILRILIARAVLAEHYDGVEERENIGMNMKLTRGGIIMPVALEICARKVFAIGDLRKALEIMRDAVSLAEKEYIDGGKAVVRVSLHHVTQAMERIFGTTIRTASRHSQMISELNLHQKLLLATLHRLLRDSKTLKPTVQFLFDQYAANTRTHRIIDAVTRGEFSDLVSNTESMGIVSLVAPGKRTKNTGGTIGPDTKVVLSIPLADIHTSLSDSPILKTLL